MLLEANQKKGPESLGLGGTATDKPRVVPSPSRLPTGLSSQKPFKKGTSESIDGGPITDRKTLKKVLDEEKKEKA